ncbi:hypothetical protein ADK70_23750 [Streptomyces rimosus subsp. pseudoverticillatus]|uniref:hypothetical protein n=1 Tax=Streptomyces rimosus TaxID=1927 RepID=UPI0006B27057|nr:hypothetical protein [Streptomyces rimosus]KOT83216.1 hypothetical protein ADK70_23750 [Streptomyces rimosus subsp. pseudoverticillatus]
MSRESDSSSSGAQGRGGAAYPSGTPPYGTPREADDAAAADAAAKPEEPKTETTLTTRIKINIPGSRPIPPVVVRKPVGEESGANGSSGSGSSGASGTPGTPGASAGGASDGGSAGAERTGSTRKPEAAGSGGAKSAPAEKTSDWFSPRKPTAASAGSPSAPPAAPAASPDRSGATPPQNPAAGGQQRPDLPFFSDAPAHGGDSPFDAAPSSPFDAPANPFDGPAGQGASSPFDAPGGSGGTDGRGVPTGPAGPSGPTAGPATGDVSFDRPSGFQTPGTPGGPAAADDTAILTPQPPAPPAGAGSGLGVTGGIAGGVQGGGSGGFPGGAPTGTDRSGGRGSGDHISSDTLVGGIPAVPADAAVPSGPSFPSGPGAGQDTPAPPRPKIPEPINAKKKGRNKIVLLGVAVVVLAGVAYGAGLLLDHADVPNGTTALGVDIGGSTKEEAVKKLDAAVQKARTEPLKLTVDGKEQTLVPAKAGLNIDTQATVRDASGRDYNPVSVISSLFGGTRTAKPAMITDDEKLDIALKAVAGPAGAAKDGGITFENGKAVPHYGTPYKAVDVKASKSKIEQAYLDRATTGKNTPVVLAAVEQRPKADKAAVDRAMKEVAEPAVSGWVYLSAGGVEVPFSQRSIGELLSFTVAPDGKLQPVIDLAKLEEKYGHAFDNVSIDGGSGKVKMTPKHAAHALDQALRKPAPPAPQKRIAKVEGAVVG